MATTNEQFCLLLNDGSCALSPLSFFSLSLLPLYSLYLLAFAPFLCFLRLQLLLDLLIMVHLFGHDMILNALDFLEEAGLLLKCSLNQDVMLTKLLT